jgi:acetylornithine deacetylase/succinyl-diaminopimelate desuccinylase-like protein
MEKIENYQKERRKRLLNELIELIWLPAISSINDLTKMKMEKIRNYQEVNKQRYINELFELIRIPSISSSAQNSSDIHHAAEYLKETIIKAGADKAMVIPTAGNPVVYGEKNIDPLKPTILVYGHYDVMPVDPVDQWLSPPFEPEIRDDKIFARGADDDKGQVFIHIKAFESMVQADSLPCNVKFLIEGEEEIGSPNLEKFCSVFKEMLSADVILISDTGMIASDIPSITIGLRGITYHEVEVTGPNQDLHSGLFGGAVANPIIILSKMISALFDEYNCISIPGFYNKVLELSPKERARMALAPFDLDNYKNALDISDVWGERGYSTAERTGIRPCLDVCGIWGGYCDEGAKTVIPSKAFAKISMRLVPEQNHVEISKRFEEYFMSIAPPCVKVKVTHLNGGQSYISPVVSKAHQAASMAYETVFGKKPIPVRSGGSIPIVSTFERVLGIKSILMGFGLESDAIHSPNENFPLVNFFKGIETISHFYKFFSKANSNNCQQISKSCY